MLKKIPLFLFVCALSCVLFCLSNESAPLEQLIIDSNLVEVKAILANYSPTQPEKKNLLELANDVLAKRINQLHDATRLDNLIIKTVPLKKLFFSMGVLLLSTRFTQSYLSAFSGNCVRSLKFFCQYPETLIPLILPVGTALGALIFLKKAINEIGLCTRELNQQLETALNNAIFIKKLMSDCTTKN